MNIQIDTLPEIIAAGLIALLAVALVVLGLVMLARKGRLRVGRVAVGEDDAPPCAPYVEAHSAALSRLEAGITAISAKLEAMDLERQAARGAAAEASQASQRMFRMLMVSQDATLDALQAACIGNGNIEKARLALAEFGETREGYLISQLGQERPA